MPQSRLAPEFELRPLPEAMPGKVGPLATPSHNRPGPAGPLREAPADGRVLRPEITFNGFYKRGLVNSYSSSLKVGLD